MTTATDFTAEVALGAAFLDESAPDWRDRIDADQLDLKWSDRCVLAQVYATSYWDVLDMLSRDSFWAVEHGFTTRGEIGDDPGGETSGETWDALRDAWIAVAEGDQ